MLAIGRGLMADPKLLLLDEPSLGLAPIIIMELAKIIVDIYRQGLSIILVEQNARMALNLSDYAYVIETGKIALEGPAGDIKDDDNVKKAYLGG